MVSEEGYDEEWNEDEWNDSHEGFWADERKARKARMMMAKEENQEMANVSPTMFNLRPHRLLPYRTNSSNELIILLQHQALVMVSLQLQRLNQHVRMP